MGTHDQCNMATTSDDTSIHYLGKLTNGPSNSVISRADRFELDLKCDFAKEVGVIVHDYFVPLFTTNLIKLDSGTSEFVVDMSLFLNEEMTEPIGEGHEILIPKPIYAKLEVQEVDGFVVKVRSCWATPTANADDATTYKFIDSYHVVATESNEVVIFQNCVDSTAAEDCGCSASAGNARKRRSASAPDATLKIGP